MKPPRLIRQPPSLTPRQVAVALLVCLMTFGLGYAAVAVVSAVWRWVGMLWGVT